MAVSYIQAMSITMRYENALRRAQSKFVDAMSDLTSAQRRLALYSGSASGRRRLQQRVDTLRARVETAERARDRAQRRVERANRVENQVMSSDYRRQLREDTQDAIARGDRSAAAILRGRAPAGASEIYNGARARRKYLQSVARRSVTRNVNSPRNNDTFGRRRSAPGSATTARKGG